MKNAILNLAAVALLAIAFSSCKKDPSFDDQLVGNWKSTEVKAGSIDYTSTTSFDLRLQASHEFELDVTSMIPITGKVVQSYNGDWSADEVKQDVTLTYNGTGETKTWEVTAISATTLTAELLENNVRYQVKFEQQ